MRKRPRLEDSSRVRIWRASSAPSSTTRSRISACSFRMLVATPLGNAIGVPSDISVERGGGPTKMSGEGPFLWDEVVGGGRGGRLRPSLEGSTGYFLAGSSIVGLASSAFASSEVFEPDASMATAPPCSDGMAIFQTSFEYQVVLV